MSAPLHRYGDPIQSARDFLRACPELVGSGKLLTDPLQVTTKRITEADVKGRLCVQITPDGSFGKRGVHRHQRIAVATYAPDDPEAYDLYALVAALLCPDVPRRTGWTNAAGNIIDVNDAGGVRRDVHPDYLVPFVRSSFSLLFAIIGTF